MCSVCLPSLLLQHCCYSDIWHGCIVRGPPLLNKIHADNVTSRTWASDTTSAVSNDSRHVANPSQMTDTLRSQGILDCYHYSQQSVILCTCTRDMAFYTMQPRYLGTSTMTSMLIVWNERICMPNETEQHQLTPVLGKSLPGMLLIKNVITVAQKQLLHSHWTCMRQHWLTTLSTLLWTSPLTTVECCASILSALLSKVFPWQTSYKEFYWQSEVRSMLRERENQVVDCSWPIQAARLSADWFINTFTAVPPTSDTTSACYAWQICRPTQWRFLAMYNLTIDVSRASYNMKNRQWHKVTHTSFPFTGIYHN